jgi:Protein of unknown function (DUF3987)
MGTLPSSQNIEDNVIQIVKDLIETGKYLNSLPELGLYAHLCQLLLEFLPEAPDKAIRYEMLNALRRMPVNKLFDDLLKHGFDPPAEAPELVLEVRDDEDTIPPLEYSILDPALARGACPWLDDEYVPFSQKWSPRAPEIHHIGCGLWSLSTLAMRRVAAKEGRTIQPTPLYIQLVAPSSVWGKTTTARIAVDLLEKLDLGWTLSPNMITPEKFLKNLAGTSVPENYELLDEGQKETVRLKLAHSGQRGWYYSEFGQLLREMADNRGRNALFKAILLRMDDCELTSRYDTVGRDLEEIQLPYLTLLGTMTPDCMRPYSGSESSSWGDGFYARFAFCCVPLNRKKTQQDLEKEEFPSDEGSFPAQILQPLRDFHTRLRLNSCEIEPIEDEKGKVDTYRIIREPIEQYPITVLSLHPSARKALNDYGNALALRAQDDELAQFRSYYSRLRDKTLRMATLFAALQESSCIEIRHIARAQQIAEQFRQSIHQLAAHLSRQESTQQPRSLDDKIMKVLTDKNVPLTAREVSQCIRNLDTQEARSRLDALELSGVLKKEEQGRTSRYFISRHV